MDLATASYLESTDAVDVNTEDGIVLLSKLFQWYSSDFGETTNEKVKWIKKRVKDEVRHSKYVYLFFFRLLLFVRGSN